MSLLIPACADSLSSTADDVPFEVILFYKYVAINDARLLEAYIASDCFHSVQERRLIGRIRLSAEGVNGTLAGDREEIDRFVSRLDVDGGAFDGTFDRYRL